MQTSKSRRRHERIWHKIAATFTTQNKKCVHGITLDLSIRGILLGVENPTVALVHGEQGTVQLDLSGIADKSFTCVVAHVTTTSIGLHIVKTSENFGFLLSQALFAELQHPHTNESRLDWSTVLVGIHKPAVPSLHGKMLRLTSDWIEFCCRSELQTPFAIGEEVDVHLTIPDTTPPEIVQVRGFMAEPLHFLGPKAGCPQAEALKKVAFASGPADNIERLVGLIRRIHAPRIAAIIKSRALTNALLAGDESCAPSRPDTMQNIRRFFSHMWPGA